MGIRQLVRGRVPWSQLEAVGRQLVHRYELESVRIEFLQANNWLSTPMVVNEQWFVKVISPQNAFVHALFTTGRNLGMFSSGTEGFFEYIDTPAEMAHQELVATKKIREIGVNAPRPVEAFEVNSLGVLVLEYLQNFKTLNEVSSDQVKLYSPEIFQALQLMHSNKLAHGDLRAENVLIVDTDIYFIDVTTVDDTEIESAKSYDIACTLGVLEPQVGAKSAVRSALTIYSIEELLAAQEFLDFVNIRPDHDFDAASVKGEIETQANSLM